MQQLRPYRQQAAAGMRVAARLEAKGRRVEQPESKAALKGEGLRCLSDSSSYVMSGINSCIMSDITSDMLSDDTWDMHAF